MHYTVYHRFICSIAVIIHNINYNIKCNYLSNLSKDRGYTKRLSLCELFPRQKRYSKLDTKPNNKKQSITISYKNSNEIQNRTNKYKTELI